MVTVLTNEHYNTILNFSRKITNGKNPGDLSQHVILNVLQKDNDFIKGLIDKRDINRYLWQLVKLEYIQGNSSYNRIEYETHGKENRVTKVDIDNFDIFIDDTEQMNVFDIISNARLTDIERMYLNAYKDSNCNFRQCSRDLDISEQTISKYVKQAIKKCKESL